MAEEAEKKEEQQKGKKPQKREEKAATSIVRLAGKDVNGSLPLERALDQVKGIGQSAAHALTFAIETKIGIPRTSNLGSLSEKQMEDLEGLIKEPAKYGIPKFMLNRRKDTETGLDIHLVSNDLLFATRQDVNRDVQIKSWRGYRHQYGQKVRGQRTRSTGRKGSAVGVTKKAEAKGGAAAPAGPKGPAGAPAAAPKEKKGAPAAAPAPAPAAPSAEKK